MVLHEAGERVAIELLAARPTKADPAVSLLEAGFFRRRRIRRSQNAEAFVGQQIPFHALSRAELRTARNRRKA